MRRPTTTGKRARNSSSASDTRASSASHGFSDVREHRGEGAASRTSSERAISVVFVAEQFLPYVGGAELRALRDAVALQLLGHSVRIVTLCSDASLPRSEQLEGVRVRRIGGVMLRGKLRLRFGA